MKVGDLVRFKRELKGLEDQTGIVVKLSESKDFAWIYWSGFVAPPYAVAPNGAQEEMTDFLEVISSGSRRSSSL